MSLYHSCWSKLTYIKTISKDMDSVELKELDGKLEQFIKKVRKFKYE
jgi:hypothetical protein